MAEITRSDVPILAHPDYTNEVITGLLESSTVLRNFPTQRTTSKLAKIPVLLGKPEAAFVTEDLGNASSTKPTSEVTLTEVTATMETLAVIIPIKKEVAADMAEGAGIEPWNLVRPQVNEAFARAIDGAFLFGTGAPTSWGDGLVTRAIDADHDVTASSPLVADDFNGLISEVEDLGFDPTNILTFRGMRRHLRGLKDGNDRPIYLENVRSDRNLSEVYGVPLDYTRNWDQDTALALAGDNSYARVFIREELGVLFSEHAAYTVGGALRSAFEKNLILARFEMRLGWCVAEPPEGLPFAALVPAGS